MNNFASFDPDYFLSLPFYIDKLKSDGRPLVMYGTGNGADKVFDILSANGLEVSAVFASDGFVRNRSFHGYHVISLDEAASEFPNMAVILAFGSQKKEVVDLFFELADRFPVYCPEILMDGGRIFDRQYFIDHKDDYGKLWNRLADNRSREVLKSVISYRLTADITYLKDVGDVVSNWDLLDIGNNEVFMDLGAYTGDTISLFLSKSCNCGDLIAVEPDKKNYRHLLAHCFDNLEAYNTLIGKEPGVASFKASKGRGAKKGEGCEVPVESVDHIIDGRRLTVLKFDVEGEEECALQGAVETITREKPRMLVSAYHKLTDLIELSTMALEMNPDYKVYLRGTYSVPSWDLAFYFV